MSPLEVRRAREALGFTRERLAAEFAVLEGEVRQWEDGTRTIPRRHAEQLAWQAALVARQNALAASGLPECQWVQQWEEKPHPQEPAQLIEHFQVLETHAAACSTCNTRRKYAEEHLPPLPEPPAPRWMRVIQSVGAWLPHWAQLPTPGASGMRSTLVESVFIGIFCAVGFSAIALLVGAVALVVLLLGGDAELRELVIALPLIILSYFFAGIIGGVGFGLLKPLRSSAIGWILTGMLIAAVAYGTMGLTSVLAYVYLDINIMDYRSVEDAWESLPWITGGLSLFGGVAGLYYWWKEGRAPVEKQPV